MKRYIILAAVIFVFLLGSSADTFQKFYVKELSETVFLVKRTGEEFISAKEIDEAVEFGAKHAQTAGLEVMQISPVFTKLERSGLTIKFSSVIFVVRKK